MNFMTKTQKGKSAMGYSTLKTLKVLALALVITFSSSALANNNPIKKVEPTSITETVSKLLKNPGFVLNKEAKALVSRFRKRE